MNIDIEKLRAAVSETRAGQSNARIVVALNSLTYGYWRDPLEAFHREDRRVEYLIDSRVASGCVTTRSYTGEGRYGDERQYDLRLRAEARHAAG